MRPERYGSVVRSREEWRARAWVLGVVLVGLFVWFWRA
jgi:hypothetical protein